MTLFNYSHQVYTIYTLLVELNTSITFVTPCCFSCVFRGLLHRIATLLIDIAHDIYVSTQRLVHRRQHGSRCPFRAVLRSSTIFTFAQAAPLRMGRPSLDERSRLSSPLSVPRLPNFINTFCLSLASARLIPWLDTTVLAFYVTISSLTYKY